MTRECPRCGHEFGPLHWWVFRATADGGHEEICQACDNELPPRTPLDPDALEPVAVADGGRDVITSDDVRQAVNAVFEEADGYEDADRRAYTKRGAEAVAEALGVERVATDGGTSVDVMLRSDCCVCDDGGTVRPVPEAGYATCIDCGERGYWRDDGTEWWRNDPESQWYVDAGTDRDDDLRTDGGVWCPNCGQRGESA